MSSKGVLLDDVEIGSVNSLKGGSVPTYGNKPRTTNLPMGVKLETDSLFKVNLLDNETVIKQFTNIIVTTERVVLRKDIPWLQKFLNVNSKCFRMFWPIHVNVTLFSFSLSLSLSLSIYLF
jgi:hypothetical protein